MNLYRTQEVGGSNPLVSTISPKGFRSMAVFGFASGAVMVSCCDGKPAATPPLAGAYVG